MHGHSLRSLGQQLNISCSFQTENKNGEGSKTKLCEHVKCSFGHSVNAGFAWAPTQRVYTAQGTSGWEHIPFQTGQKQTGLAYAGTNPKLRVGKTGAGGRYEGVADVMENSGAGGV